MREYDPASETDQEAEAEERVRRGVRGDDTASQGRRRDDGRSCRGSWRHQIQAWQRRRDQQRRRRLSAPNSGSGADALHATSMMRTRGPKKADEPDDNLNDFRLRRARFRLSGVCLWQAQPVQAGDRPPAQGQRRPRLLPRLHQESGTFKFASGSTRSRRTVSA